MGVNALSIRIITSGPGHSIVLDEIQGKITGFINISQEKFRFCKHFWIIIVVAVKPWSLCMDETQVWQFQSLVIPPKGFAVRKQTFFLLIKGSILKIENPTGFYICLTVRAHSWRHTSALDHWPQCFRYILEMLYRQKKKQNTATIAAIYCQPEPLCCCLHTFSAWT